MTRRCLFWDFINFRYFKIIFIIPHSLINYQARHMLTKAFFSLFYRIFSGTCYWRCDQWRWSGTWNCTERFTVSPRILEFISGGERSLFAGNVRGETSYYILLGELIFCKSFGHDIVCRYVYCVFIYLTVMRIWTMNFVAYYIVAVEFAIRQLPVAFLEKVKVHLNKIYKGESCNSCC